MGSKKKAKSGPAPWNPGEWKDGQYKNFSGTVFQNPGQMAGKAANAMANKMNKGETRAQRKARAQEGWGAN